MTLRDRIRDWLGLTELCYAVRNNRTAIENTERYVTMIGTQNNAILSGLGRVIAKLDPMYGKDELDPARKAESDQLGDEAISRLLGEAAAREPYNK